MLLVTFHGDASDAAEAESSGGNVVAAYLDDGTPYKANVVHKAKHLLVQPRAIALLPGGVLWVVNGSAKTSNILAFTGSGVDYTYTGAPVVQFSDVDSLWHPFDVTFVFDAGVPTTCFVSNQDTNTVIQLAVTAGSEQATAMPISTALPPGGTFLEATFVASADGQLPGVQPTTPVPPPQGLQADVDKKVKHSVRGVLWHGGALYVADEVAGTVKAYDAAGNYLGQSNNVGSPDHLVAQGGVVYVGSGGSVLQAGAISAKVPNVLSFTPVPGVSVQSAAGMAFDGSGNLYVADRTGMQLYRYAAPDFSNGGPIGGKLPGSPEFILYVPDPEPATSRPRDGADSR